MALCSRRPPRGGGRGPPAAADDDADFGAMSVDEAAEGSPLDRG